LGDFRDYDMDSGKGKTYRYYQGKPLYPFGHGLSYTKFEYSNLKLSRKSLKADGTVTVKVDVTNTGTRDGEEIVQLYVRDVESDMPMPVKQLREFERIALKKGEKKTVTFMLKPIEDMRYYDAQQQAYRVEPGDFEIQIGASSTDIRLTDRVTVKKERDSGWSIFNLF
jgi:beta-glucosidase